MATEQPVQVPEPELPTPNIEAASEKVTENVSRMKTWFSNFMGTKTGSVVIYLVLGIALAFITAFILYYGISTTISNQQSYLIPNTKLPVLATQKTRYSADEVPNSSNGKRSSLAFWIYIYDVDKYRGVDRHIMHRGGETDGPGTASPYIALDALSNQIKITFAPRDASKLYTSANMGATTTNSAALATTANKSSALQYLTASRGITIKYIPLQRWVHIAVVVNENAMAGGSITVYVDGERNQSIDSTTKLPAILVNGATGGSITPKFNIQDIDLDKKGDIYVGGSLGDASGPGFSGMISKVEFFNYEMNANDVYANYLKGPIDNLLAKAGLPAYGIQTPIYRIQ
jgi:hypothetical protein